LPNRLARFLIVALLALISIALAVASIRSPGPVIHRNRTVDAILAPGSAATPSGQLPALSIGTEEAIVKSYTYDLAKPTPSPPPPLRPSCKPGADQLLRPDQVCTWRREVAGQLVTDPTNPLHLIAGVNDARAGYSHCDYYYTFEGGKKSGEAIPGVFQHTNRGSGQTYETASDPAVAFDSQGAAYLGCAVFDVNSPASAIFVVASPGPQAGRVYSVVPDTKTAPYVVIEDDDPAVFNDRPVLAADTHASSPYRDALYTAWTRVICGSSGPCGSLIYFSRSTDRARSWSRPVAIAGTRDGQGASMVTGPDGAITIAFNSGGGGADHRQLAVSSRDGGRTWGAPVLVGEDRFVSQVDGALHPTCDFGRGAQECVPAPINVRIQDFPRLAIDASGQVLAAVWQDYRGGGCRSSAADALATCRASGAGSNENYEIVEAVSQDGGATWTSRVLDDPSQSAQFEPAVAINQKTGALAISFYDHGYEADAANGWYDYSVSTAPSADGELRRQRVNPLPIPTQLPGSLLDQYLGLYGGVSWSGGDIAILWSDGRRVDKLGLIDPNGKASGSRLLLLAGG
jgi:hypothetical protein